MASHPASPDFIVDITRATEGATASNRIPMNSDATAANDLPMLRKWMTSDGSPWWLQPTGEYSADSRGGDGGGYNAISNQASANSVCEFHSDSYYCQTEAQTLEPN